MTIIVYGHVENLAQGPGSMIEVTIRLENARSQTLVKVFATLEELAQLYHPGKPITLRITPNP